MPRVSINVCLFNSQKLIERTLESVWAQTYRDWELVLVDDGSRDGTAEVIERFRHRGQDVVYHWQENQGPGEARNRAIELSCGEIIALLDHDDLWDPRKLEKQVAFLDENPKIVLGTTNHVVFNNKGQHRVAWRSPRPSGRIFGYLLNHYYAALSTIMVRRSVLDGLEEWFVPEFSYLEDGELVRRIAHDHLLGYQYEPLAWRRFHRGNLTQQVAFIGFAREAELMLTRFSRLFPDFESEYAKEIQKLRSEIARSWALAAWRRGDSREARAYLSSWLRSDPEARRLWVLSHGPFAVYWKMRALKRAWQGWPEVV